MRIRTIKPEFWASEDITALPIFTRLLFIGLWSYVDDNGVGRDEEHLIASALFPKDLYRSFSETSLNVHGALNALSEAGLIARYIVDGKRFLQVLTWKKHQTINRPNKGRFPQYSAEYETSVNTHGTLTESSLPGTEEQRNRGTDISPFNPPSSNAPSADAPSASRKRSASTTGHRLPDDWTPSPALTDWTKTECPEIDIQETLASFRDYWHATPGAKGRKTDWDATWRNWARRNAKDARERANRPAYRNQAQVLHDMRQQAIEATRLREQQGSALRLIEGGRQ